ncbi:MAG: TIGR03790 family protein [Acidobacteria bacterium]|nr:TIGR03790 family protein [Acidobacteriota bacterium]
MIVRILILLVLCVPPLCAQTADNVLVVMNQASRDSIQTGLYYAEKRGIPKSNVIAVRTTEGETVSREDFDRQIAAPIGTYLTRQGAQDRILYIVLARGIPLRIEGSGGPTGTAAGVDSELALLYRRLTGEQVRSEGPVPNPYFLGDAPLEEAKQFRHAEHDIYLVSRLDGYNLEETRGLIDRGAAPSREGKILLDAKGTPDQKGDVWLKAAADRLAALGMGDRVVLEETAEALTATGRALGYYSWGSNDPAVRRRRLDFDFAPGALAGTFAGADGRTFAESDRPWSLAEAEGPPTLAADFIRGGVTGVGAHVAEPFLEGTVRPDILFPAYVSGFNLVESFYLATPYLGWQTVIVGDPLSAPFRTGSLAAAEIDRGLDPQTELPADFGPRRLKTLSARAYSSQGIHPETTRLTILADARMQRQDRAGAIQALEEAVARDERLAAPRLLLAGLYETAGEHDKAIALYRRLLELAPDNAVVLNNLAFALAVRKNDLEEALPMAEKAYALSKQNPSVADTLGWIHHLMGQNDRAVELLEEAVRGQSRNAELHLHFAIVSAETGDTLAAEVALQRALEIDPKLEQREEVRKLRLKLQPAP